MKIHKLHPDKTPEGFHININPTGTEVELDIGSLVRRVGDEYASIAKFYILISKHICLDDEHRRDAKKKALMYLKRVQKHLINHAIFNDLEILAFLKKHKRSWETCLKEIEEELKAERAEGEK